MIAVSDDPLNICYVTDEELLDDEDIALLVARGGMESVGFMSEKVMFNFEVLFVMAGESGIPDKYIDNYQDGTCRDISERLILRMRLADTLRHRFPKRSLPDSDPFARKMKKSMDYLETLAEPLAYMSSGPLYEKSNPFYNLSLIWGDIRSHSMFDLLVESTPGLCARWLLDEPHPESHQHPALTTHQTHTLSDMY